LEWGVFYDVKTGVGNLAKSVSYALAKTAATLPFANETITASLYKWVDANTDNTIDFATELTAVGLGTETVDPAYANFAIRELKLDDLNTGNLGVVLENNTKYFISITAPKTVFIAYDNQINDNDYVGAVTQGLHPTDAAGTGNWFGGFSGGQLPVIGLNLTPVRSNATATAKPTAYKVNVFPNPTSDLVNMSVNFETATNATYEVTDITGKVLYSESHKNATTDKFTYNTRDLAAGAYNIVVRTEAGVQSSRFIVAK
ncbi:MAG: Secretion system C-terminal sorting domain, partial [Bacteroidota bacterium]